MTGRMQVSNFTELWREKQENGALKDEFESIPRGSLYTASVGESEENSKKNRLQHLLPYDKNRVKLKLEEHSLLPDDYINASWIESEKHARKFISTPAPLSNTTCDFWRMVYEQKASKIVMLTRTKSLDGQTIYCEDYWPRSVNDVVQHGPFTIKCNSQKMLGGQITFSQVVITKQGCDELTLHHCHYEGWPDLGVPGSVDEFLRFLQFTRRVMAEDTSRPVVVHCLAGVGRSGTFIALDILLDQIAQGHVAPYDVIMSLRHQRINMVETQVQYNFIHEVLEEAIKSSSLPFTR